MATARSRREPSKVTAWQALRDIMVASMNKGLFIPAALTLIFLFMLYKMPDQDVAKLVFRILDDIENGSLIGYIVAGLSSGAWFIHSRWQRRTIHAEMERLALERNELQHRLLGGNMSSSDE